MVAPSRPGRSILKLIATANLCRDIRARASEHPAQWFRSLPILFLPANLHIQIFFNARGNSASLLSDPKLYTLALHVSPGKLASHRNDLAIDKSHIRFFFISLQCTLKIRINYERRRKTAYTMANGIVPLVLKIMRTLSRVLLWLGYMPAYRWHR